MSSRFTVSVLNLLVTTISIAIALPGIKEKDYRIMTLTFLVYFMGKFLSVLNSYGKEKQPIYKILILIESLADITAIAFCFHYLFVILNIVDKKVEMGEYSIFDGHFYFYLIISVSAMHVLSDLIKCGFAFFAGYRTSRQVLKLTR